MPRFLWTQRQDIGPRPRVGHTMAYDSERRRTVLFGGSALGSRRFGDTWEWDGENWTQVADSGPRPRADCPATYDSVGRRTVLFGGDAGGALLRDTWQWDGSDWTQLADTGPASRAGHTLAFDSIRGRAVLFGGESLGGLMGDTWEWDGDEWTQQEDTGPGARRAHAMAYDSFRGRVVLFGGAVTGGSGLGDTWEWNGNRWSQVADFGPDPCFGAGMVFKGDSVALFGGIDSLAPDPPPRVLGNTWEWDGRHWTQRQDIGPGARWSHGMSYDGTRRRIVVFGGLPIFAPAGDPDLQGRLLGDTWEHSERGVTSAGPGAGGPTLTDNELVIGRATAPFPRDASIERRTETAMGNLIADALRLRYGTQLAIVTAGEIRAPLPSSFQPADHTLHRPDAGYVQSPPFALVRGDVFTVLPFGNRAVTRLVSGALLWEVIEHSLSSLPVASGAFAQISGFRCTYRLSATPGARVQSIRLADGTDVTMGSADTFTLAVSSSAAGGGDGYAMLADGQGLARDVMADVVQSYIQGLGTIEPRTEGRITQLP